MEDYGSMLLISVVIYQYLSYRVFIYAVYKSNDGYSIKVELDHYLCLFNIEGIPRFSVEYNCVLFRLSDTTSHLYINDLGTAMTIYIGSLSSVNLAFVLPCVAHINTLKYRFNSFVYEKTLHDKLPLLIAMFGVVSLPFMALFLLSQVRNESNGLIQS